MNQLAIEGGPPVHTSGWPAWPILTELARQYLIDTVEGTRWSVVSAYRGKPSKTRECAQAFARSQGATFCTLTPNGSASLLCALEAAGVGAYDEVIVPGLTWVASASAVLNVNAVPVLADIDPHTLCVTAETIERVITPRTKAILVVHLYSAVADMTAICALAASRGITVIEDCAQAHGAMLAGRHVGTFGALGCFSMHQSKVLTCGEGGAVITNDRALHRLVEQLHADGRVMVDNPPQLGASEFLVGADMMGSNHCLSELQAAILLGQMSTFEAQQEHRNMNARRLDSALGALGSYRPQSTCASTTRRTYYQYTFAVDLDRFDGIPIATLADAATAELGVRVFPVYPPMDDNPMYRPRTRRRFHLSAEHLARLDPDRASLPVAEEVYRSHLTLHHSFLLGSAGDVDDVAKALEKLDGARDRLRMLART